MIKKSLFKYNIKTSKEITEALITLYNINNNEGIL